jgi:hypothetical protein
MTIYWMKSGLDAKLGGVFWSETTNRRQPGPHNRDKWFVTDADRAPLGPYPQEIIDEIDRHWALTHSSNSDLPDTFNVLSEAHFSGVPFACRKVCDVFQAFAKGDIELKPIKKFWSLSDKAEVSQPYWAVNFYGAVECLDLTKASVQKVEHPRMGNLYFLIAHGRSDIIVRGGAAGDRHIWRDKHTSDWFCDDVFRAAIEEVTPKTFDFIPATEA